MAANTIVSEGLELDGTYAIVFELEIDSTSIFWNARLSIVANREAAYPNNPVWTYIPDPNNAGQKLAIPPRKRPH